MTTPSSCNAIQERIVAGDALDDTAQAHALSCASCSRVAAEWLALDSVMATEIDGGITVPDDFANRVMGSIGNVPSPSTRLDRALGRRWVQIALANVGVAVAVTNLLRFVLSLLLPATSLGGTP